MTQFMRAGLLAAISLFALLPATHSASAKNLISNGSFELPEVPDGQTRTFAKDTKIGAWQVTSPANADVLLVGPGYTCCGGVKFLPQSGDQSLCLTGTMNGDGGVKQKIKTVAGKKYRVTFYIGNLINPGQGLGTSSTVTVLVDGAPIATKTNIGGSAKKVNWKKFTATFTAETSKTTISFFNDDPPDDSYNGLDNVTVVAVP